ncbi:Phosphoglycerate mutase protein 2 [Spatholobus suberectus]|nr:Phosphoglycerate mutase protein 2 [Spatholobus suberectus]
MQTTVGVFGGEAYTNGINVPPLVNDNVGDSGRPAISSMPHHFTENFWSSLVCFASLAYLRLLIKFSAVLVFWPCLIQLHGRHQYCEHEHVEREEAKALKHLRRIMVPRAIAIPVPNFDHPFYSQRSSKDTTKPK